MSEHDDALAGSLIPVGASESVRSRAGGMAAAEKGLVDFKGPRDWRLPAHRANVRQELERGWADITLPGDDDTNVHYYLHLLGRLPQTGERVRIPALPKEGDLLPFLLGYALGQGRYDVAAELAYELGMLPVGTEPMQREPGGSEQEE